MSHKLVLSKLDRYKKDMSKLMNTLTDKCSKECINNTIKQAMLISDKLSYDVDQIIKDKNVPNR